jgi:hypothetical protein
VLVEKCILQKLEVFGVQIHLQNGSSRIPFASSNTVVAKEAWQAKCEFDFVRKLLVK